MTELYPRLIEGILQQGKRVAPRGKATLEVSPLVLVLEDPRQSLVLQKARRLNRAYAAVEKLGLVAGVEDPAMFCFYVNALREYVNPCTNTFDGAYGPRVANQLPHIYDLLRSDPDSRRAVISIYNTEDQHESNDVPCTLTLQFLLRNAHLDLLVNMRSSDLYLGLPYDVNQFCFLQMVVANWIGARIGRYIHFAGSGHIYESDIPLAKNVIERSNEVYDWEQPEFTLSFEETLDQLRRFFDIERQIREQGVNEQPIERLYSGIHDCLRPYLTEIVAFTKKRK